ncbi:transferase 2, rSAM/selenodomain-associated [Ekhidna lutea]|uniref:Transferase 2, rSAM/selenodomain-associated n=1 Tax=Ekhidna lutea TaxID=447679 RepID=A0A239H3D8_EKHLU|nr:TIGR04283 family arsenosugar biosynthesis glycosyltransferase [Ekhidna lutea]SNS75702.1 transferase 2, rSAM/selenodomain-associated [Ekhidna lutea]
MFVSIIIPTLNEEQYIGSLLDFLSKHQAGDRFEVIVVDGGSSDGTLGIVKERQIHHITASPPSRAHQMNEGAKLAKGDILYFVHADTKLLPTFIDDIQDAVNQGFNSGCYRFKFDSPQNILLHINGFFTRFPFTWCRGGDQTLFITRNAFETLGGFDEHYVIMEDYDLLERIAEAEISFKVLPKSVKVSPRKYQKNSYLKVQLTNLKAMKMYKRGVEPMEIRKFYTEELE